MVCPLPFIALPLVTLLPDVIFRLKIRFQPSFVARERKEEEEGNLPGGFTIRSAALEHKISVRW